MDSVRKSFYGPAILLYEENKSQGAKQLPWSHQQGGKNKHPGLQPRSCLHHHHSWFPQREEIYNPNEEEVPSMYSNILLLFFFKTNWGHTSVPIIPPQLENCGLHESPAVAPCGLHCLELLCGTGCHNIDHVLIRRCLGCRPQSLSLSDLFLFLLPMTVIIFQPPSPHLADIDQMVSGQKLPQFWVHDVCVSTHEACFSQSGYQQGERFTPPGSERTGDGWWRVL